MLLNVLTCTYITNGKTAIGHEDRIFFAGAALSGNGHAASVSGHLPNNKTDYMHVKAV